MSATTALPLRPGVTILTGLRTSVVVAGFAEVTGTTAPDHAITIALISVVGGFVVMLVQIVVKNWLTTRHRSPKHPDHDEEQADLNQILVGQMVHLQRENDDLRTENDRLKHKRQR